MSNFFEELKNRNVYKVAVAYLVSSWLIIQVVDTIGPNLNWSDSIGPLITKILIVGFPIALVLTWLYEFTPKGLKLTGKVQEDTTDNRRAGRRLNRTIIGVLAVTLCFMLVERIFFAGNTSINEKQRASIAVLPFNFQSSDNSLAFMSDALSGAISDRLGQISGLTVTSKTSSSQFKDEGSDAREIGEDLDVNYLIEGDLQFENNRIRLRARLINASNGYVRWQEQYDEEFSSIMEIEEDLARKVVNELRVEVFPDESLQLSKKISENSEAYKLYLEALELGKLRTDEALMKAMDLIQEALELEPGFAKAHAELVTLYRDRNFFGGVQREVMKEKMQYHYKKAREIDPDLAEVYFAGARIADHIERDSSKAIAGFRKAIELKPNYSEAHYELGRQLRRINRALAAESELKAYELDPYNDFLASMVAQTYKYFLKDDDRAMEVMDKILEKNPITNFCGRMKSSFLANAPHGDLSQAFITLHKSIQGDKYEALNLGWIVGYSMELDLAPLAERYLNIQELKYPNGRGSFYNRYSLNSFRKDYIANLDLVSIWDSDNGYPGGNKSFWLADVYQKLGNAEKAKTVMDEGYPELAKQLSNLNPNDPIPYSKFAYEIDTYIDIFRELGNDNKAEVLADISCNYLKTLSENENDASRDDFRKLVCFYNRYEVDSLVRLLDKIWFKDKERKYLNLYMEIQTGYYRPFEKEPKFLDLSRRVTEETHRMRAEVIAYLKEVDDWNPAWDKELGLD